MHGLDEPLGDRISQTLEWGRIEVYYTASKPGQGGGRVVGSLCAGKIERRYVRGAQ